MKRRYRAKERERLVEAVWQLPSEVEESCRDGALKVVEARRGQQWKAILRHPAGDVNFGAGQEAGDVWTSSECDGAERTKITYPARSPNPLHGSTATSASAPCVWLCRR